MMKYILTIIFLLISLNVSIAAQLTVPETISAIENNIFGYDYKNESELTRIERIEEHLYGQKKSGTITKRLEDIQNDSGFVLTPEKPIYNKQSSNSKESIIPEVEEDSTVEYPMVDSLEKELFNTTYSKENIYNRLNRLEEKVFGKTSSEDLHSRVDKLASVVRPKSQNIAQNINNSYSSSDINNYYNNSGLETINDQSVPFQLAALEEDLLRNAYINENISNRLSRLEQKLFNRTFASDTDITRLQRIMVAYDAKKNSYKYDNNRKMQNMAALTQFGGILLMILAILL